MIEIIRRLIELIHGKLAKKNHVILYGWPNHEASTIALESALRNTDVERIIILISGDSPRCSLKYGESTIQVRKNSFRGLWLFLRAKYVFFTHPCFVRHFPNDVISINVWHGMPIKRIGRMLQRKQDIQAKYTISTSPFWQGIIERSMPPKDAVLMTGLPRNDHLFNSREAVMDRLDLDRSQRLIAWLPTYRKSVRGELRLDGNHYESIFEMPDIDPIVLNTLLKRHHAILWVKPHPMASSLSAREWSHIRIIEDESLVEDGLSLYQLLAASDLLITDISSVVIDFLLVDKPIIHAFPDIEEYRDSRGFSVEPIEDFFAGEVVNNQEELLKALDIELSGTDPHAKKRRAIRDLSHVHQDDQATQRLLKAIDLM